MVNRSTQRNELSVRFISSEDHSPAVAVNSASLESLTEVLCLSKYLIKVV